MRLRSVTSLLLTTVLLLGCVDNSPDTEAPDPAVEATTYEAKPLAAPPAREAAEEVPLRFSQDALDETLWFNGSIGPNETFVIGSALAVTGLGHDYDLVDLSSWIPEGIPVELAATLEFPESASTLGSLHLSLRAAGSEVYDMEKVADDTAQRLTAQLARFAKSPVKLSVLQYYPEPREETPYTLRIDLRATPGALPSGVPASVHLPGGSTSLRIDGEAETPAALLVWGPDDRFIGRVQAQELPAEWEVPAGTPEGPFVFFVVPGSGDLRLSIGGGRAAGNLAPLQTAVLAGEPQSLTGRTEASWAFDVERVPLAVGIRIDPENAAEVGGYSPPDPAAVKDLRAHVASPVGDVLETTPAGPAGVDVAPWAWWSAAGAEALTAGTYTVSVEAQANANVAVSHLVKHFVRDA